MVKLMMLIWMMIGVLTMSEAVSRMLCWSHASCQWMLTCMIAALQCVLQCANELLLVQKLMW